MTKEYTREELLNILNNDRSHDEISYIGLMTMVAQGVVLPSCTFDAVTMRTDDLVVWEDRKENDVTLGDLYGAVMAIRNLQCMVGARNTYAGWRTDLATGEPRIRSVAELTALVHTEISEAFEGHRRGDRMDDKLPHRKQEEVELADAIYRILDWADERGLDVGGAFMEKMAFNIIREDHKKSSRVAEGGKKI